ncbi:MAG: acyltransferase [Alphaproteobacteria bacterium]|nr:MAG: acyltransferase [Alphaproteobacteria bacterium]
MAVVGAFRIRVRFLGKHSLFEGPFGWLFYWLGGIPVRRESAGARDLVDEAVTAFTNHEQMILGLAPEGTRSKVERWKSGYYRIAIAAGVPIQLAFVDSTTREIGLGPLFLPTGDMAADTATIQAFYEGKTGVRRKG